MHRTKCDDCGNKCEVPFKPTGSKPIYCSDCFSNKGGGGRSGGSDRRGGGRFDRRQDRPMHKATCDDCGSRCEVPFRPSGDKPIYCDKCFGGSGGKSGKGSCQCEKQFEDLNEKLDKILKLITPVTTVDVKKKVVEKKVAKKPTAKKASAKKKETKKEKKKAPAKKPAAKKKAPVKKKTAAKKKK